MTFKNGELNHTGLAERIALVVEQYAQRAQAEYEHDQRKLIAMADAAWCPACCPDRYPDLDPQMAEHDHGPRCWVSDRDDDEEDDW